jgi:hypothetical protein
MIIGINGYAGSGKDTIGILIQLLHCDSIGTATIEEVLQDYKMHEWWLEEKSGWEIKKWAGKLKTIASLLTGIPVEKFEDQDFKKTNLGPEWGMTVRDLLQKLGTDACRDGLHKNTWVNALMSDYRKESFSGYIKDTRHDKPESKWIITDTRFPNEAQAIKDAGGIVIRVDRPGVSAINAHPSETGLDNWDFDHKIMNGSDIVSLMFSVHTILKKNKLINADFISKNQNPNHP